MRIGWISPYLPLGADSGGRIRITRLAEALGGHELHLFAALAPDDRAEVRAAPPWHSVAAWPPDRSRTRGGWWFPAAATQMPAELSRALADAHRAQPFDALVVEHSFALGALDPPAGVPLILDEHNVESDRVAQALRRGPRRAALAVELLAWRRFERRAWRRADAVAVVCARDAERVRGVRPACVVENGVDLAAHRYTPPSRRTGDAVLFVGHLGYPPNIAAALLLAREVMPRLRRRLPAATLTLAGRAPAPIVRALAGDGVQLIADPPEIASLYERHAACAQPVFLGAGTSLKALDPLAAGVPLVASPFAVRGLPITSGGELLLADDAPGFAERLAEVLSGRARFDAMAARGRALAERHDWPASSARFAELIAATCRRGAAKRRRGAII